MIVIICALKSEAKAIMEAMSEKSAVWREGEYISMVGKLADHKVLLMVSNAGKVNAAGSAVRAYFTVKPSFILNIGLCGGLRAEYEQGDIVVPSAFVQYDIDTTAVGDPQFFMSGVGRFLLYADNFGQVFANAIENAGMKLKQPRICATGDTFVTGYNKRHNLYMLTDADVCDMEAGAIAQICAIYGIPFASAKIVSDSIGDSVKSYKEFMKTAPQTILRIAEAGVRAYSHFEGRR